MQRNDGAKDLAGMLLAHRDDGTMQYLYRCMYGKPMPDAVPEAVVGNIIPFPKRLSLGQRRKILRDAMQQLETGESE
jgi:hypothetical protein